MLEYDAEFEWMKLDNSVELFGIHVFKEYDNIIADKHPDFNNVFRFETKQQFSTFKFSVYLYIPLLFK